MGAAPWGLESQMSTTWYPGNPDDATQQFTVAGEIPSEWGGEWNLTRLNRSPCSYDGSGGGSGQDVVSPGALVDVLEDMQRTGQLLRVTWTVDSSDPNVARRITRLGRIKRFQANYVRSTDVEWTCTLAWKSRGAILGRVATTRQGGAADASAQIVAAQVALNDIVTNAAIVRSNPGINLSATKFSLGQLEQLANYPKQLLSGFTNSIGRIVNQIGQVAGIVNQVRNLPASLENTVVGLLRNTIDQANQFADLFSSTPVEQMTLSDNVHDMMRSTQYLMGAHDNAVATSSQAETALAQVRSAYAARAQAMGEQIPQSTSSPGGFGGILAIYRTKQGDTPQKVAQKFYGTIDQDVAILRANRLPYYQATFAPGTLLVIPVASSTTASNL